MKPQLLSILIFLIVVVLAIAALWKIRSSARWPTATGRTLNSEIETIYNRPGRAATESLKVIEYVVRIDYEYTVSGRLYTSDQVVASTPSIFRKQAEARELVERFPDGQTLRVHYNPRDPTDACLISGSTINATAYIAMLTLILLVAGLIASGTYFFFDQSGSGATGKQDRVEELFDPE